MPRMTKAEKTFHQMRTGCASKRDYPKKDDAKRAIKHFKEKFGTELISYKCKYCYKFHLRKKNNYNPGNWKEK